MKNIRNSHTYAFIIVSVLLAIGIGVLAFSSL